MGSFGPGSIPVAVLASCQGMKTRYNRLGEYCGPHTASSMLLIVLFVSPSGG